MRVSIIIPCYRQAHYLPAALESCFAQTYKDLEILVVNDGSDDHTEEVALSYGDRVRYLHRANGGLSAARNTGIAAATGQFLKFLDSDDHLHPAQIEWQVSALRDRPGAVSVTTLRAYQEERPEDYRDFVPTHSMFLPDMLRHPDGGIHAYLFPAEMVRAVKGFDELCRIAEDWEFFCRLGRLRVAVIPDPRIGGYYRLREGSMSTARKRMTLEVARRVIQMHDEFRDGPNRDWFGLDLLSAEQRSLRSLLVGQHDEEGLQKELIKRIRELWRLVGPPPGTSLKYRALRRVLGQNLAERIYARYARFRRQRSPN